MTKTTRHTSNGMVATHNIKEEKGTVVFRGTRTEKAEKDSKKFKFFK